MLSPLVTYYLYPLAFFDAAARTNIERYCPAKTKVGKKWYQSIDLALTFKR
jgi:hypothetical protein